jgi:hypothetical protein
MTIYEPVMSSSSKSGKITSIGRNCWHYTNRYTIHLVPFYFYPFNYILRQDALSEAVQRDPIPVIAATIGKMCAERIGAVRISLVVSIKFDETPRVPEEVEHVDLQNPGSFAPLASQPDIGFARRPIPRYAASGIKQSIFRSAVAARDAWKALEEWSLGRRLDLGWGLPQKTTGTSEYVFVVLL